MKVSGMMSKCMCCSTFYRNSKWISVVLLFEVVIGSIMECDLHRYRSSKRKKLHLWLSPLPKHMKSQNFVFMKGGHQILVTAMQISAVLTNNLVASHLPRRLSQILLARNDTIDNWLHCYWWKRYSADLRSQNAMIT